MVRNAMLLAACVSLAWAPIAAAQRSDEKLKVGDYAPDFEAEDWVNVDDDLEIPSLAELRGLVVVVFFWVSRHEGGEVLLPYVTQYERSQLGRSSGVYTVGLTDAPRKQTEAIAQKAMAFFPIGTKSKAAEEYGIEGGFGFVVIDAEGRVAHKGRGGDLNGLQQAVVKALQDTPPTKTHPEEAALVRKNIAEARKLISSGSYRRAFELARDALEVAVTGDELRTETYEIIDLLEALGYERLDRVQPLIEQDEFDEAAELLRSVQRHFAPPLDAGLDARELHETLEDEHDDFRDIVRAHVGEDEAADLLLAARADVRSYRFGEASEKLNRILTDYEKTKAAKYAGEMLARMQANPAVWGYVKDYRARAQCETWMAQVRSLMRQRRHQEARQLLERIRNEYPGTVYDEEAKRILIDMPA